MDFVLVHGTTQSPAGWDRLAGELLRRRHNVRAIDLSAGDAGRTVADYARAAVGQAGLADGRRVVVGHSGAGVLLPAIAAATGASVAVWLAAYVPDFATGRTMAADIRADRGRMFHQDWLGVDPTADPELAIQFLFHDCDPATREWALGTLRLFDPGPAVYQHAPSPPSAGISRAAIVPTRDRTLRPEWLAAAARRRLGAEPAEIEAGHCPHVSQPAEVADILVRI